MDFDDVFWEECLCVKEKSVIFWRDLILLWIQDPFQSTHTRQTDNFFFIFCLLFCL